MKIDSLQSPPLGWNSFDSYSVYINEEQAMQNLEVFIKKLKPHGYEYFCIDSGWFMTYDTIGDGKNFSTPVGIPCIDEYGRYLSSPQLFPNGLKVIADKCHENGLKFGVHLMRGLPVEAINQNCKIFGTNIYVKDLVNPNDRCSWCDFSIGFDATTAGAQEYYSTLINHLCEAYEVDFIKYDDLCDYPDHIELIGRAIEQAPRKIFLSQSPGDLIWRGNEELFKTHCNSIRVSRDIWDTPEAIRSTFERWELWEDFCSESCFIDLDMIPFGNLLVNITHNTANSEFAGQDSARKSRFSLAEKEVFITQRALAASPLIMGGDLLTLEAEDLGLITNPEILACNQNGVIGKKIYCKNELDIRKVTDKNAPNHGWIGIFNVRAGHSRKHYISAQDLGFEKFPENLFSVWEQKNLEIDANGFIEITMPPAYSVLFIKY